MTWIHPLSAEVEENARVLGGKAYGLIVLKRLGLPVPPGFVIGTEAGRAFLRDGRLPDGLDAELAAAVAELETVTRRRLGGPERPLTVSVRSGGSVSMPGMLSTILNLGLTAEATEGLAAETGDPRFALDSRLRFLVGFATTVLGLPPETLRSADAKARDAIGQERPAGATGQERLSGVIGPERPAGVIGPERPRLAAAVAGVQALIRERAGEPVPDDAARQLELAVRAVFASWDTPRAQTYRELHDIPHDLGTAVTVQAMVFGNRDRHSGTGVAFSRDPNTGGRTPFGEVLFGGQGEEVVSGTGPSPDPDRGALPRRVLRGVHLRGGGAVDPAGAARRPGRPRRRPRRGRPGRRGRHQPPRGAPPDLPAASSARSHAPDGDR
jgi:pyruvate,orthophosphate dikinase